MNHVVHCGGGARDPKSSWLARFHRDPKSTCIKDQRVPVEHGRPIPDGPALLKSRREMSSEDAVALWFQLRSYGWTVAEAALGADA